MQHARPGKSISVWLCDAIENDIVTGVFRTGDRLDEARLARRYDVSRTPVREALRQLAATERVEIRTHRGAFVTALTPAQQIEMFEVMAEIEGTCAKLAARRITPDRLASLLNAHSLCRTAVEKGVAEEYYYANEVFHHEIYAATGNGFLERQAHALQVRLRPFRRLQLRVPQRMEKSFAEHQRIIDAIASGQADAAAAVMISHILVQVRQFNDFVSNASSDKRDDRCPTT